MLKLIALNYTVMLNGYSSYSLYMAIVYRLQSEGQFYREISSIGVSDAVLQS